MNAESARRLPFRTRRLNAAVGAAILCVACVCLQAAESPGVSEARRALSENIPEVAILRLKSALTIDKLAPDEAASARRMLAEAQLNAGQPSEALATLTPLTSPADTATQLLRALALAATGRWESALPIFDTLAGGSAPAPTAVIGKAECLQALGRPDDAVKALQPLVTSGAAPPAARLRLATLLVELGRAPQARVILNGTPPGTPGDESWRHYLNARIHLSQKNPKAALDELLPLTASPENTRPAGLTHNLFAAVRLAESEARLALQGPDAAAKILESFIRLTPDSPQLELVFRRLDQIYALETDPGETELQGMASALPPRAASLALFHLARLQLRQKLHDRATATLTTFLGRFPDHALVPYAHGMFADVALAKGDLAAAETALDAASRTAQSADLQGQFAVRTALVNLQQREFVRASSGFRNAAGRSPRLKLNATYNDALAWLMQKNHDRFDEALKVHVAEFPDPVLAGDLRLEQGLVHARSGDSRAPEVLRTFLRDFPDHPRRAEAQYAIAELALNVGNPGEAERVVQEVPAGSASPEMQEHAAYLAVFLEDAKSPRDENKVIALAKEFITGHPASPMLADVRMKLGQVFFRGEDFLKAREQFEILAREQPESPQAAAALFLAGQSAMKLQNDEALNHALELFGTVADKHGPLEINARILQAIIKYKLGQPDDAVKIYDSVLSVKTPLEPDLRIAALAGKGDSLVALGKTAPAQLTAAIAAYDQIIATAGASPTWRNQAAYKKAKVLEQLDKGDEALAVFHEILTTAASGPRETFWFSKAGFDAAAIAEARRQWKTAVAVYEKMAAIPGPHVSQARQRIKTLRLEHFLWD